MRVRQIIVCGLLWLITSAAALAQTGNPNVSSLGALTCQQLWYLEQEILADNRICLEESRAQRAFQSAKPCISSDERVLPDKVRNYLSEVRKTGKTKSCHGF